MQNLQTENNFDVIIIGGGAAGLSAALWCDDLGLSALLVEAGAELGGQLLRVYNPIKNHLGSDAENGRQLRDIFVRQTERRKFTLNLSSEIKDVDFDGKIIRLAGGEVLTARAIVIATGVRRRRLDVPGEREFTGKGIVESGKRDGKFLGGKTVVVAGGGDAAFENALIVAEAAKSVTLVHRNLNFRARAEFTNSVSINPKIKILPNFQIEEITGGANIESLKLKNLSTGESLRLPADALIIRIGVEPSTDFARGKIDLDDHGYIKIDHCCQTNIKNVFAVGDAASPVAPTVSGAVGMGATAVKAIYKRLNSHE